MQVSSCRRAERRWVPQTRRTEVPGRIGMRSRSELRTQERPLPGARIRWRAMPRRNGGRAGPGFRPGRQLLALPLYPAGRSRRLPRPPFRARRRTSGLATRRNAAAHFVNRAFGIADAIRSPALTTDTPARAGRSSASRPGTAHRPLGPAGTFRRPLPKRTPVVVIVIGDPWLLQGVAPPSVLSALCDACGGLDTRNVESSRQTAKTGA